MMGDGVLTNKRQLMEAGNQASGKHQTAVPQTDRVVVSGCPLLLVQTFYFIFTTGTESLGLFCLL